MFSTKYSLNKDNISEKLRLAPLAIVIQQQQIKQYGIFPKTMSYCQKNWLAPLAIVIQRHKKMENNGTFPKIFGSLRSQL